MNGVKKSKVKRISEMYLDSIKSHDQAHNIAEAGLTMSGVERLRLKGDTYFSM